jgi:hypothetical protein
MCTFLPYKALKKKTGPGAKEYAILSNAGFGMSFPKAEKQSNCFRCSAFN